LIHSRAAGRWLQWSSRAGGAADRDAAGDRRAGLERLREYLRPLHGWTYSAVGAIALTILIAAPVESPAASHRLQRALLRRSAAAGGGWLCIRRSFTKDELSGWIWETWKFVKQIFPLLIIGVFLAGIVKVIIPETWVRTLAGQNTIWANMVGVIFGVFMYFPTLVEVPVAKMFLDLGMARGPLLAYLLADPELSLQSILVLNGIMGKKKTVVYVGLVAVMATLAGYLFGRWKRSPTRMR
jgi:uncharacterized protein